jgi:glucose uptake protein
MYIVESYTLAVVLTFVTMLCWGSWANTQKLAEKSWRFLLGLCDWHCFDGPSLCLYPG